MFEYRLAAFDICW